MATPAQTASQRSSPRPEAGFQVRVPGHDSQQAHAFLASVHGASVLGAGRAASVDFARLRSG